MLRKYDHLFFDLDNTLWDFDTNSYQAMKIAFSHFGLIPKLECFDRYFQVYQNINNQLWEAYRNKKISKAELSTERFTRSLAEFKVDANAHELNSVYLEHMACQTRLYPNTLETLEKLKQRGYQMHIITNGFREVQYKKLSNSKLDKYFHRIFVSEEVNAAKPDRAIFEHALKTCNARKSRSIMIGDNWEVDILGAARVGIDQIMISNPLDPNIISPTYNTNDKHPEQENLKNGKTKTFLMPNIINLLSIL